MHASDAAVFAKQALDLPWLQPPLPMAAAPTNYGCSPRHLWLQPPSPMVAGAQLAGRGEGRCEGRTQCRYTPAPSTLSSSLSFSLSFSVSPSPSASPSPTPSPTPTPTLCLLLPSPLPLLLTLTAAQEHGGAAARPPTRGLLGWMWGSDSPVRAV